MQAEAMEFQEKIEKDYLRFKAELSSLLQCQNNQFQASLMQSISGHNFLKSCLKEEKPKHAVQLIIV